MKNNFRVISMCSLMAAFATSSWAACPSDKGFIEEEGECYYNMPENGTTTLEIPSDVKSFRLVYLDGDGNFTSTLMLHCQSSLNTVSVKGSADLAGGGTLKILNRVNLDHFDIPAYAFALLQYQGMTTEDIQPKTPIVTCSNKSCDISKTTGLNALNITYESVSGDNKSFELVVTQEQYDYGPMQVLNVQGIDKSGMLATGAAMAGVDVSKIPDGANNGLLIRGADENDMMPVPADINVDYVYFDREFSSVANARSTLALPFSIASDNIAGASEIWQFTRVGKDPNNSSYDAVYMKKVYCAAAGEKCPETNGTLDAYKPYIVVMKSGVTSLKFNGAVTLEGTSMEPGFADFTCQNGSNWVFRGIFKNYTWTTAPENVYGYAGSGDYVGQFVKVGNNVSINPFRAILTTSSASPIAPANSSYALRQNVLPDEMNIVIEGDNNETTVIGSFNTRTGEMKFINNMKHTYDLKGRRVNGTNNARGAYYGKKVLMK
ncbi:MAG: hypothetical protein IKS97_00345 [Fibrobacter sp.]|nr:hypothetical protein [Fibrobacter sp.]